jgi:hypothetical protein
MTRIAASLAVVALGLSACMSQPPKPNQPRIATQELPYRAGAGVVIASTQAPAPVNAAAGGSVAAASTSPMPHRLAIRMDRGGVQYVDTDNPEINVGSRVELGADRTIRKL